MLANRVRIGSNQKDNMINVRVYDTSVGYGEVQFTPLLVPIQDADSQFYEILDNLGTPVTIKGSTINNPINIKTSKGGKVIVLSFTGIPMSYDAYLNGVRETYSDRRMDYGVIIFEFNNEIKENDLIKIDIFFD